ncbi:CinA-like protein [Anaerocolumna cellulosilytica]|uniref:Putative competence-damage inducible protein n=1 Tax=Anaerocolumna cellulosilytica TaxID=433286 RepID=A0A6S6R7Y2_9FIRM|nr:competence/damage-inducible protein A [Anaerocolumna cellulosilytica]MBB5197593.1 nicotinamide-nucleotide amidase [Anaerocolumna cellulosilytica]BCJ95118.1 CinA-like protein [Anaerocolumna cellulosilytica]
MIAELISVGTEILLGNIVNTNANYLAVKLAELGISNYFQITVGDNEERLADTIKTALNRSDIVIITGGLGPTKDDLTKEVTARVLGKELVEDVHSREQIKSYFAGRNVKDITSNNWKQALVVEGSIVIDNYNGTAPGLIAESVNGKKIILLPGPPNELYPMFEEGIIPYLRSLQTAVFYTEMVKVCGIGESKAETMIADIIAAQTNPTIAPYAKDGEVHLRVTASATTIEEGRNLVEPMVKELRKRFQNTIYTTREEVNLEDVVVKLLTDNKLTVALAESCTGGLLAGRIVNVAGVSSVLGEGFITYSNEAKQKYLGVDAETLKSHGAVSAETAIEMAKGAAKAAGSDASIAVTGIAGPEGGTQEKPVGLVYVACYLQGKVTVQELRLKGNRQKIRNSTVIYALNLLRNCILDES